MDRPIKSPEELAFEMAVYLDGNDDKKQGADTFRREFAKCLKVIKGEDPGD